MTKVTIRDVAAESGVSVATVSRILREVADYTYDQGTQRRVKEAAVRLNYRPNMAAQLLRTQKKRLVGVVSELTVMPHANEVIVAIRDELRAKGLEPVLIEPKQLAAGCTEGLFPNLEMLAGIICYFQADGQRWESMFKELAGRLPVVTLFPFSDPDADWIYMDLSAGVQLAADHLVELGHREIAFAGYDKMKPSPALKAMGWQLAVEQHKLERAGELTFWLEHKAEIEEGGELVAEWLSNFDRPPTALICTSDELAMCVLGRLADRGWKLPDSLSVVGMDGIQFGAYAHPPLTSVRKLGHEMARLGIERLIQRIENPALGLLPRQLVEPQLLIRASTTRPMYAGSFSRTEEVRVS